MSQARVCGDVLSRSIGHSLEEWVGCDAAGAVLSHPTGQALEKRVGGDAAGTVLSRSTLPGSMKQGRDRGKATLHPQRSKSSRTEPGGEPRLLSLWMRWLQLAADLPTSLPGLPTSAVLSAPSA